MITEKKTYQSAYKTSSPPSQLAKGWNIFRSYLRFLSHVYSLGLNPQLVVFSNIKTIYDRKLSC